jgi:hypothetical protein
MLEGEISMTPTCEPCSVICVIACKMAMFGCALPEGFLLTRICGGGFSHVRYGYEGSIFFCQYQTFIPDASCLVNIDKGNIAS